MYLFEVTMRTCFVIMPYGGEDQAKREHYLGVYQSIIEPAAIKAGYTPHRSDISNKPGNITNEVIKDLASADIVIADLTEGNPNVFFELGIRHVLRKSGTVHIIDKDHKLPFDINQYRVVQYSTRLSELPTSIISIVEAIEKRSTQPNISDNPVHDAIPSLPADVRTMGDDELRNRIEILQQDLEGFRSENEVLKNRLVLLDPNNSTNQLESINIEKTLSEADTIMALTGENALLRLIKANDHDGRDGFIRELREVLKSPYLSEIDFMQINRLCGDLGLPHHGRAVLEIARAMYPEVTSIFASLAAEYQSSPNPTLRARGRVMVEGFLGIEHTERGPKLTKKLSGGLESVIGVLFNFYFADNNYEWIVSISESLEENLTPSSFFRRNKARAYHKMGQSANAETTFKEALALDPHDDTVYAFYADFLDDEGRYKEAYEQFENAICADPEDGRRYINLGDHIHLRGIVRDASGELIGPISKIERYKNVMPLFLRALTKKGGVNFKNQVVSKLVRFGLIGEAQAINNDETPEGEYNLSALNYVDNLIERGNWIK